jgi:hypothetical protein
MVRTPIDFAGRGALGYICGYANRSELRVRQEAAGARGVGGETGQMPGLRRDSDYTVIRRVDGSIGALVELKHGRRASSRVFVNCCAAPDRVGWD